MRKLIMTAILALAPAAAMAANNEGTNSPALDTLSGTLIGIVGGVDALPPVPQPDGGYDRIVGGVEAGKREFPFIVSLQSAKGFPFCGGSLIKKDWVLTAAHCVRSDVLILKTVVVGLYDQRQTKGAEKLGVDKVIVHPNYDNPPDYDFALVHLSTSSKFAPIALNEADIPDNTNFVAAGWGRTAEGGEVSDILQKVTLPLVSTTTCSAAYADYTTITDHMICAGFAKGGKDTCQGDSGGPLLMGSGANRVLAGVVSWGYGCAEPGKYGVYAKVSSVASWIESVVK